MHLDLSQEWRLAHCIFRLKDGNKLRDFGEASFYLSIVEESATRAELNVPVGNDTASVEVLPNGALHHIHEIGFGQGETELIPVYISILLTIATTVISIEHVSMTG